MRTERAAGSAGARTMRDTREVELRGKKESGTSESRRDAIRDSCGMGLVVDPRSRDSRPRRGGRRTSCQMRPAGGGLRLRFVVQAIKTCSFSALWVAVVKARDMTA